MKTNLINKNFNIGDKVKYTHSFLKSINADYSISSLTGIVQSIKDMPQIKKTVVRVLWNDGEMQSSLACNLVKINMGDITE